MSKRAVSPVKQVQMGKSDPSIVSIVRYLGGKKTLKRQPRSQSEVHDLIVSGMPGKAIAVVVSRTQHLDREKVATALGVSTRTIKRKSENPSAALSPDQGDRAWKFSRLMVQATEIFGGEEQAERWLDAPAIGLNHRKPIDLLATAVGASLVEQLLGRMEHGVYT